MVKVTLITNNPRVVDIVPDTMTVREFLEKHDVNYAIGTVNLDGIAQRSDGLDTTFADHGVTKNVMLSCLANKDNGAQAIVVGSSCVVKSALTPDEIKRIKKFHPEALKLYDEDDEPMFAIDIDEEQPGSINENGACFSNATSNDGKATITVLLDPTTENPSELVYDQIGSALARLKKVEDFAAHLIPDLNNEENEIRSMIVCM